MLFAAPEIESRDRFEAVYGKDVSLKLFIRQLVGLDRNAAKLAFAQYLSFNASMPITPTTKVNSLKLSTVTTPTPRIS